MPFQDSELDRLARDRDQAKRNLDSARHDLDMARSNLERMRSMYGPKLDYLKSAIPDTKINMVAAFEQATSSWNAGHKSDAKDWSNKGNELKAEKQRMYDQKEECITILKAASEAFHTALTAYHTAKAEYETDRDTFFTRLSYLKEESARKREEREAEIQKRQHEREKERDEREKRWQYVKTQRQRFVQLARVRWLQKREEEFKANADPREVQDHNPDFHVEVSSGWSKDHGCITTDIVIAPRDHTGDRYHIVLDESGNELLSEWHYKK